MNVRGLLLLLAGLGLVSPARGAVSCDNANLFSYSFNSAATGQLSYGGTTSYTATSGSGATRTFSVSLSQNGLSSATLSNGVVLPRIDSNPLSTPTGGKQLIVGGTFGGRTSAITGNTRVIQTTISFPVPVRELSFTVHDLDFASNQFRDWFMVTGSNGAATYTPALSTPWGNNNSGTPTATGSSVRLGPGGTPALAANEAVGTAASANNATTGNVNVVFQQPVTSVTLRYGNYPFSTGENTTGQQFMGVSALSFCPLPVLSVSKSSAPLATTGAERFNVPGTDVVYSLTVTNSGGSIVDLGSLVLTDVLPPNVTFFNGDFDPATPGMGPFELASGSSGVSLPAGGRAYSNNNGASYAYDPASGYDAQVDALRLTPAGSMAANSTFTIRFRARVN